MSVDATETTSILSFEEMEEMCAWVSEMGRAPEQAAMRDRIIASLIRLHGLGQKELARRHAAQPGGAGRPASSQAPYLTHIVRSLVERHGLKREEALRVVAEASGATVGALKAAYRRVRESGWKSGAILTLDGRAIHKQFQVQIDKIADQLAKKVPKPPGRF